MTDAEVVEWLSVNHAQSAFCFPLFVLPFLFETATRYRPRYSPFEDFGLDILSFSRCLDSQQLLLVMLQARKCPDVRLRVSMRGVRSVTPEWLWKNEDCAVRL